MSRETEDRVSGGSPLTHVDAQGHARMVDVSDKPATVRMSPATVTAIREATLKKGDLREVARLAGVMAAKRVGDLIPLCHPVALDHVDVDLSLGEDHIRVEASARTTGRTGVEMEALTAASVTALTIYDMAKAMDRGMVIDGVRLLEKRGGASGPWIAPDTTG